MDEGAQIIQSGSAILTCAPFWKACIINAAVQLVRGGLIAAPFPMVHL